MMLQDFSNEANYLIAKPSLPHILVLQDLAKRKTFESWHHLSRPRLEKDLDMCIDPLQPLNANMALDVYETFEADTVKYRQYDHAIEIAIDDLRHKKKVLQFFFIRVGRVPLLRSVLHHSRETDEITVVEKNPKCICVLETTVRVYRNVSLKCEELRNYPDLDCFDLVVSELLGSFGCNEACPEILQRFSHSKAVMIPESNRSVIHYVYTGLEQVLSHKRPYLIHFSTSVAVTRSQTVFEFTHPCKNRLNQTLILKFDGDFLEMSNALCGYFEATLYGPYKIGNSPSLNALEKCSSWFPTVFPIEPENYPLVLEISRASGTDLRYFWKVNDSNYGNTEKKEAYIVP